MVVCEECVYGVLDMDDGMSSTESVHHLFIHEEGIGKVEPIVMLYPGPDALDTTFDVVQADPVHDRVFEMAGKLALTRLEHDIKPSATRFITEHWRSWWMAQHEAIGHFGDDLQHLS